MAKRGLTVEFHTSVEGPGVAHRGFLGICLGNAA